MLTNEPSIQHTLSPAGEKKIVIDFPLAILLCALEEIERTYSSVKRYAAGPPAQNALALWCMPRYIKVRAQETKHEIYSTQIISFQAKDVPANQRMSSTKLDSMKKQQHQLHHSLLDPTFAAGRQQLDCQQVSAVQ